MPEANNQLKSYLLMKSSISFWFTAAIWLPLIVLEGMEPESSITISLFLDLGETYYETVSYFRGINKGVACYWTTFLLGLS